MDDGEKMRSEAAKKLVTLEDYATIRNADMDGFKFVHSPSHDEALGHAVFIADSRFINCDFSELRSLIFSYNLLTNCAPPPMNVWAEVVI